MESLHISSFVYASNTGSIRDNTAPEAEGMQSGGKRCRKPQQISYALPVKLALQAVQLDDLPAAALLQQQTELLSPLCLTWAPEHSMPPTDNAEMVSSRAVQVRAFRHIPGADVQSCASD